LERQQELQVNTTKIAKMKKKNGSQRSDGKCETQAWGKKAITNLGHVCKIQTQPHAGRGTIKLISYGQMNNIT
jgi:hypothetical protein